MKEVYKKIKRENTKYLKFVKKSRNYVKVK